MTNDDRMRSEVRMLECAKYMTDVTIAACDRVLEDVDDQGVTAETSVALEKLRRGLEFADEHLEYAKYVSDARVDQEFRQLVVRLRERIEAIEGRIAAAKPN